MLRLGDDCVSFEPGSTLADVFYDNLNHTICTVRGNGVMGITAKGLKSDTPIISTRIKDLGKLRILKFNATGKYAAVQRRDSAVDVVVIDSACATSNVEVQQSCKSKVARITGLEWVANNQLLIITTHSLELYQLTDDRKNTIKLLRSVAVAPEWTIFHAVAGLLLVATGPTHSALQPFVLRQSQITKLAKFEIDFGLSNANTHLIEQNVNVEIIYGRLYVWALRFSRRDASISDVALYEVSQDASVPAQLKYILSLGLPGMVGVHVIDSLVIVHLQQQRRSLIFDVGIRPDEQNQWALIETEMEVSPRLSTLTAGSPPSLYSHSWVVFSPDIVIDPALGLFSRLSLNTAAAANHIRDTATVLSFLHLRGSPKKDLLNALAESMMKRRLKLKELTTLFNSMNDRLAASIQPLPLLRNSDTRLVFSLPSHDSPIFTQDELKSYVFIPVSEPSDPLQKLYVSNAMLSYIRSLKRRNIAVDDYLLELTVETLVAAGELSRLHQLVTYGTIGDSKPLAFLLIQYEARYQPLFQAGVDMLMRTGGGDEIAEVLLAKGQLVEALRYMDSCLLSERPTAGVRVLEKASTEDRPIRHALLGFFQMQKRGKQPWPDAFRRHEKEFKNLFSQEELEEAEREVACGDATLERIRV